MTSNFVALAQTALTEELELLARDVRSLIESLSDRELWAKPVDPGNSVGHLTLHLIGNLNHFVGRQLGHTDYTRDREREFTETHVPSRDELLKRLGEAVAVFRRVVSGLGEGQLMATHPEAKFGPTFQALTHFVVHFAVHRGQMSYLARIMKDVSPPA